MFTAGLSHKSGVLWVIWPREAYKHTEISRTAGCFGGCKTVVGVNESGPVVHSGQTTAVMTEHPRAGAHA